MTADAATAAHSQTVFDPVPPTADHNRMRNPGIALAPEMFEGHAVNRSAAERLPAG